MNKLFLLVILAFVCLSSAFEIQNTQHELPLQNTQDYADYIKTIKGFADEQTLASNPALAKIVEDERISMLNAVEDIVLVLVDKVKQNSETLPSVDDLMNIQSLGELVEGFDVMSLASFDDKTVEEKIAQLQNAGKIVHELEISNQLAKQFQSHERKLFSSEQGVEDGQFSAHKKQERVKVGNTASGQSASYVLKFFFSLIFIIVCLGSLAAIANMQNKKDTLLYAKFIADVGQR